MCQRHRTTYPIYKVFMTLSALGTPPESYRPILTAVILDKLPSDIKIYMARDHYDSEWNINTLPGSVQKEIRIYEAGQHFIRKHTIS